MNTNTPRSAVLEAADANPLGDEYVNAVIQRHGYDSPESVIAQLHQWIGLHGGEDSVTLLMYVAHKALSKLRAPVADDMGKLPEYARSAQGQRCYSLGYARGRKKGNEEARAALASAPLAEPMPAFYINPSIIDPKTGRIGDHVKSALTWSNTKHHGWQVPVFLSPPLASAPVSFDRHQLRALVDVVWNEATESTAVPDTPWADRMIDKVFSSLPAIAPVAGEAHPAIVLKAVDEYGPQLDWTNHWVEYPIGTKFYAAPQASEAVRILFPTHLRKMWSGGEVQAWLDEHQGVTAPTPSAKGSLERYRKWQAEQAVEAQCSCPSGDGSLRWPCPAKHPLSK